ncbi:hypothetical protein [Dyadobacter sp. BHUBP1]|uniref:hypothetical protein n=1 Tax=Dyadobacter sp. BHUBP1 TaxID=3424178 RepID=UPI003D32EAE7
MPTRGTLGQLATHLFEGKRSDKAHFQIDLPGHSTGMVGYMPASNAGWIRRSQTLFFSIL